MKAKQNEIENSIIVIRESIRSMNHSNEIQAEALVGIRDILKEGFASNQSDHKWQAFLIKSVIITLLTMIAFLIGMKVAFPGVI